MPLLSVYVFNKLVKMCHMPISVCIYNEWKECTMCLLLVYACGGVYLRCATCVLLSLCVCVCVCVCVWSNERMYFCLWNFSHLSLLLFEFWVPFLFLIISISIVSVSFLFFPLLYKRKESTRRQRGGTIHCMATGFHLSFSILWGNLMLDLLLHQYQ